MKQKRTHESLPDDGCRQAATAVLEELSALAAEVASQLQERDPLPPPVVAALLLAANKQVNTLQRHQHRLKAPKSA